MSATRPRSTLPDRGGLALAMPRAPAEEDDAAAPEPEDEDHAIDLPPLDDDEEAERDEGDDAPLETGDDLDDPLDDAAAADLEADDELDLIDDAEGETDAPEDAIDVGALDEEIFADDEERWVGQDEAERDEDGHDDLAQHERPHGDDGGVEGTSEDPADAIDEAALPALDADDGGDFEGEDLLSELGEAGDARPPAWDPAPWAARDGAGAAVPCSALAVAGGRVAAAGEALLVVPPGEHAARRAALEIAAASVALTDGALVIATPRGRVLRSDDFGATATTLGAWGADGRAPVALAATSGRLWILAEGALWSLPAGVGAAASAGAAASVIEGPVRRIAAAGGALIALVAAPAGPRLERLRGDDEGAAAVPLSGAARRAAEAHDGALAAAAQGRAVALSGGDLLCVSRNGGATFRALGALPPVRALAFAGDGEGAPLLALVAHDGAPRGHVVLVPAKGEPTRIAAVGAPDGAEDDDEGAALGPAAIAWDASREVAWIACGAGLFAIAPAREH